MSGKPSYSARQRGARRRELMTARWASAHLGMIAPGPARNTPSLCEVRGQPSQELRGCAGHHALLPDHEPGAIR
jgi:hypothetical protein